MILQMKEIEKRYGNVIVLKDFSLKIKKQELLCIIGPSGCGKSTLLNLISGHLKKTKGTLINHSTAISYVFQEDRLLPWKTVSENIEIVNKNSDENQTKTLIDKVELNGFEDYYPKELSGGMRQRCAIARAFNYESDLLLMDEPFKSLDYNLRFNMIDQVLDLWEMKETAILFVTHEIDEALLLGDKIIVLSDRPTKIATEFDISKPQRKRKLTDEKLMKIRAEIIGILRNENI